MDYQLYGAFVFACIVVGLIPGPNVALIVANSLSKGMRAGFYTVAGTVTAMVPQLIVAVLGLSVFLTLLSEWFEWLRWAGVLYFLYLGFSSWTEKPETCEIKLEAARNPKTIYIQSALISAVNPKVLLFFAAFLPQFIVPEREIMPQMIGLAALLWVTVSLVDVGWVLVSSAVRTLLAQMILLRGRLSAVIFAAAGLILALAKAP